MPVLTKSLFNSPLTKTIIYPQVAITASSIFSLHVAIPSLRGGIFGIFCFIVKTEQEPRLYANTNNKVVE